MKQDFGGNHHACQNENVDWLNLVLGLVLVKIPHKPSLRGREHHFVIGRHCDSKKTTGVLKCLDCAHALRYLGKISLCFNAKS